MAGHSKWKQIKHYKAATDAKRGAHFTKLIREITMAAKLSGGDPAHNPRLRTAIDAAKARSMPKDNIERAIKKGTGELEGVHYTEVTYEGYGPGGVAILISALSDNPTRTVAEIRHKLTRLGGNLGTPHSVSYLFDLKGQIYIESGKYEEDTVLEIALDSGAEDFKAEGEEYIVTTDPHSMHTVADALKKKGVEIVESEVAFIPKSTVHVEGKNAESLVKLLEELEDLDDVQKVSANFDMDVEQMSGA
jgi:YebC/PmpR family DNA-binding regulatory protein